MVEYFTFEELSQALSLNPETGELTWLVDRRASPTKGTKAGHVGHNGYLATRYKNKKFSIHRAVWLLTHGYWPKGVIDHINGDKLDNRPCNLRDVQECVNALNIWQPNTRNRSGFRGVSLFKNRWRANIRVGKQLRYLGSFSTAEEASAAYLQAKQQGLALLLSSQGPTP